MSKIHLPSLILTAVLAAFFASGITLLVTKYTQTNGDTDRASTYVRQAMLRDPQMLQDTITALQNEQEEAMAAEIIAAIQVHKAEIYTDTRDPVLGNPEAKFTLVEFYDYNCGHCKSASKWTKQQLETYPEQIRVIFKDLPILAERTPSSIEMSAASLAAWKQGPKVYADFHFAMMQENGELDSKHINVVAKLAGVDVEQMRADMAKGIPQFQNHISDTMRLAAGLNIDGTPAFIANGVLVNGADIDELQRILDRFLAKKS